MHFIHTRVEYEMCSTDAGGGLIGLMTINFSPNINVLENLLHSGSFRSSIVTVAVPFTTLTSYPLVLMRVDENSSFNPSFHSHIVSFKILTR